MTHAKSNYAAGQLNDIFYKRGWHKYGVHAYPTDVESKVDIQWRCDGAPEVVRADPLALLRWMDAKPRRWADLDAILRRKLDAGQTPPERPKQGSLF